MCKHKTWMRYIAILLALVLLFCGCTGPGSPATVPGNTTPPEDTGPIPSVRTGIRSQGTFVTDNAFECTEDGIYVVYQSAYNAFLLYGDHGSDRLIKLCGRPDCDHTGEDCNAHFYSCQNICYYDGYLYAVEVAGNRPRLYHMNLDGSGRVSITSSDDIEETGGFSGVTSPLVCNGVFFFYLTNVNEDGETEVEPFYYLLDGSMERPEPMNIGFPAFSDGENLLSFEWAHDGIEGQQGVAKWDPETNTSTYLTDIPLNIAGGYWGVEAGYYLQDGIIYRLNYADGSSEALFDTGLEGFYQMTCFPDCIVISKARTEEERMAAKEIEGQVLYLYDWDFQLQGQVEIDYPLGISAEYVLCGETSDRLLLAARWIGMPEYYIEKSDFGTGNIEIHSFNLPELEWPEMDEEG